MNIKSATKFGLIGAVIAIVTYIVFILHNTEVISLVNEDWDYEKQNQVYKAYNIVMNLLRLISAISLATFFYVLNKNQK